MSASFGNVFDRVVVPAADKNVAHGRAEVGKRAGRGRGFGYDQEGVLLRAAVDQIMKAEMRTGREDIIALSANDPVAAGATLNRVVAGSGTAQQDIATVRYGDACVEMFSLLQTG